MVKRRFTVTLKRYESENRGAGDFNELSASRSKSCNFRNELRHNSSGRNTLVWERREVIKKWEEKQERK